jgi:hypothetical protein
MQTVVWFRHGYNVEAALRVGSVMPDEEVGGCASQTPLFVAVDCGGPVTEFSAQTKSNFDEYQLAAVLHYQIDLSVAATVVSGHKTQTSPSQVSSCGPFSPTAALRGALRARR